MVRTGLIASTSVAPAAAFGVPREADPEGRAFAPTATFEEATVGVDAATVAAAVAAPSRGIE